jgi:hypothetical protein
MEIINKEAHNPNNVSKEIKRVKKLAGEYWNTLKGINEECK